MKFLGDRYEKIYTHKGYDICTLKVATPSEGDNLGFKIDHEYFEGKSFLHPDDAIQEINKLILEVDEDVR